MLSSAKLGATTGGEEKAAYSFLLHLAQTLNPASEHLVDELLSSLFNANTSSDSWWCIIYPCCHEQLTPGSSTDEAEHVSDMDYIANKSPHTQYFPQV